MNLRLELKHFSFDIGDSSGHTIRCNKFGHGKVFCIMEFDVPYKEQIPYLTDVKENSVIIHFGDASGKDRHLRIDILSETLVKAQKYVQYEPVGEPVEWDFNNIYPVEDGIYKYD